MTLFHFLGNLLIVAGTTYLGNKYLTATPQVKNIANTVIGLATAAYTFQSVGFLGDLLKLVQGLNVPIS